MPNPKTNRFDPSLLLDFRKADIQNSRQAGQYPDDVVILRWVIPYGAAQECKEYIYDNYHVMQNVELPTMFLEGTWRTVSVESQAIESSRGKDGHLLVWQIAKGLYTQIDWESARRWQGKVSGGNSNAILSVQSEDPAEDLYVEFPYCDPDHVHAMCQQLYSQYYQPPALVVRGEQYGSGWTLASAVGTRAEDGTHLIRAHYTKSKYILNAYTNYQTVNEEDVWYIWRVPKDEVQPIIDSWKAYAGPGATVTSSYNEEQTLADLVLRKRGPNAKQNLTTPPIYTSCSSYVVYHFAYGYTKDELGAFFVSHAYALPPGWTRRIFEPRGRGDGLFDAEIVEIYENPNAQGRKLGVYQYRGIHGSRIYVEQGFGVTYSDLELAISNAQYDDARTSRRLQWKRNDNCTYDYELLIDESVVHSFGITQKIGVNGAQVVRRWKYAQTVNEIGELANEIQNSVGDKDRVDIVQLVHNKDNDSFDVVWDKITEVEAQYWLNGTPSGVPLIYNPVVPTGAHSPPNYIWAFNVAAIPNPPSGWRYVQPDLSMRPSGRIDFRAKLVKEDGQYKSQDEQAYGLTRTRQTWLRMGVNVSSLPPTPDPAVLDNEPKDWDLRVEIDPQTGLLSYKIEEIKYRVPADWAAEKKAKTTVTWQKRSRVISTWRAGNKMRAWVRHEKRKIEMSVKRTYHVKRPEAEASGLTDDYEVIVEQLAENLWAKDIVTTTIGIWEPDGVPSIVEVDA